MWVLIFIVAVIGSPATPATVHQEFQTESTCRGAEESISRQLQEKGLAVHWGIVGGCFPR
jgi:hypothetical protein